MAPTSSNTPDLDDTSERQAALRRYHILDTEPEKDFDRITSLVAKVCDVPTALITLIDEERQWFKSCFGFDARETDIGVSFCVHAVHQGEMLVVEDATTDPRFKDNPIVTGPPHIRFYAGAPLTTPEGIHIGTLCIIDYEAQPFDAAQREILERLADVVVNQFEFRSAEAQIRQLVDENPQPMYVYAQGDGSLLRANSAARTLYGYDDVSSLAATDLEAPTEDQPSSKELSLHKHKDGSYFPVRLREREVLFDGRPAILAVPQSISERHDPDTTVFFQTDLEGVTRSLSTEWTTATGFSIEDTIGGPLLDFVHPLDRSATADVFSSLLNGEIDSCQHETSFLTEDGAQRFELRARLVRDENGAPTAATGLLTPITEEDPSPSTSAAPSGGDTGSTAIEGDSVTGEEDGPDRDGRQAASATKNASAGAVSSADEGAETADTTEPESPSHDAPPDEVDTSGSENGAEETAPDDVSAPSGETADANASSDAPNDPTTAEEQGEDIGGVFSTNLPSFADAAPSSPSAPIDGPDETEATDSTGASSTSDGSPSRPDLNTDRDLHPEPFDLTAQLRAVLDENDQSARRANVALRRSLPDGSLPVRLDPQAVRDMVDTLIGAAITDADTDAVTVRVEDANEQVSVLVEGTASVSETALLRSARRLADEMEGSLTVDEDDPGLVLTLPRSLPPRGDGDTSILPSESA